VALPGASLREGKLPSAILSDAATARSGFAPGIASVMVENVRSVAASLAARFFGHPARELGVVGVTGTNGKTSTVAMTEAILRAANIEAGLCGTLGARIGGEHFEFSLTFPEACTWHALLARARTHGCRMVLCEITSESATDHRLDGTRLNVAAYTNLSRDHLDTHETMEAYAAAKASIFARLDGDAVAVLNADEQACRELVTRARTLSYGIVDPRADLHVRGLRLSPDGSRGTFVTPDGPLDFRLAVPGRFNVYNALAAAGIAIGLGVDRDSIARGLATFTGIAGRVEQIANSRGLDIRVDYAHTPDALDKVLRSLREVAPTRRIITVFGCGGDRDRGKRPLMGRAASRWSDHVIVTSDNPRSEDPAAIIADVAAGLDGRAQLIIERREAIAAALELATLGDVVLIAGKGHERHQEIAGHQLPFDDRAVVRELLASASAPSPQPDDLRVPVVVMQDRPVALARRGHPDRPVLAHPNPVAVAAAVKHEAPEFVAPLGDHEHR
jgi:UDP-N-acetylmuramoyl-L-alanyl-D-glutamate--2,6-diaminopimelate ligase